MTQQNCDFTNLSMWPVKLGPHLHQKALYRRSSPLRPTNRQTKEIHHNPLMDAKTWFQRKSNSHIETSRVRFRPKLYHISHAKEIWWQIPVCVITDIAIDFNLQHWSPLSIRWLTLHHILSSSHITNSSSKISLLVNVVMRYLSVRFISQVVFHSFGRSRFLHLWSMRWDIYPTVSIHQWSDGHYGIAKRPMWHYYFTEPIGL